MRKICGIWQNRRRIYAAYMRHIFPHISGICKFEWQRIKIMVINRPFLHILTFFTSIYSKYNCIVPVIVCRQNISSLKTTLDKKNAEKMRSHMRNMWRICEFLHMRHNFRICDSENAIICGKICDMRVFGKICNRIFAYN